MTEDSNTVFSSLPGSVLQKYGCCLIASLLVSDFDSIIKVEDERTIVH